MASGQCGVYQMMRRRAFILWPSGPSRAGRSVQRLFGVCMLTDLSRLARLDVWPPLRDPVAEHSVWRESAFKLYLKPGDTITLEATTGLMAEALNTIYAAVNQLNEVYQSIIMVAGTEPDAERDYNIQKEVQTLLEDLASVREKVLSIMAQIEQVMGETNPKIFFRSVLRRYSININKIQI